MGASIDLAVWVKGARTFASKTQDDLADNLAVTKAADAAFFCACVQTACFFKIKSYLKSTKYRKKYKNLIF